jgi:RNA polymerase sigma-70 factor, ECF subfamily
VADVTDRDGLIRAHPPHPSNPQPVLHTHQHDFVIDRERMEESGDAPRLRGCEGRNEGSNTTEEAMELCAVSERAEGEGLLAACRRGDREAFRELFEVYQGRVYSVALHYTGEQAAARDITQQVFLKLFTRLAQFREEAEFTTWLYRLVANTCLDEKRRGRRFVPIDECGETLPPASRESAEESYSRREVSARVQAAIRELKPKLRLVILLKYVEGMSYEEIARALGCSPGTVASRLNRGHKALAGKLAGWRGATGE